MANLAAAALLTGLLALLSGVAGINDGSGEAVAFVIAGLVLGAVGWLARRHVVWPQRPAAGRIMAGLCAVWGVLILLGAVIYLVTGAIQRVDDALVEAAAGFTTTALTTLDPSEASSTVLLWRAGTSWIGGLFGILAAVVALPQAFGNSALLSFSSRPRDFDLVPATSAGRTSGRRRVLSLYAGFTLVCAAGYLISGMGPIEAAVHSMGTASTGGFSTNADSFTGYGATARAVATAGMLLAGSSIFVLWWLIRGRVRPLARSQELRVYIGLIAVASVWLSLSSAGLDLAESLFTVTSVVSTTGYAVTDWTVLGAGAIGILLVIAGVGAMLGSAGSGLRILRARLLLSYAARELRRQLQPHAVIVVRHDDKALDDRTTDRIGGYQIAHLAVVGGGALLLGMAGMSLPGSVWASVSAVSNLGPALGEIGAYGQLDTVSRLPRLVLIPLMVAGRVEILPLLALLGFVLEANRGVARRWRRLLRSSRRPRDFSAAPDSRSNG